jgi:flagellar basal body-associated protein FliL
LGTLIIIIILVIVLIIVIATVIVITAIHPQSLQSSHISLSCD